MIDQPTVLVAPLNWGLGHATRCIPLIKAMERLGVKVIMASDGAALNLLKAEFPHLPAFHLPSYRIRYQTDSMVWNLAKQLPRITYAIRAENWATQRLIHEHGISGIISDNRYGCFSARVQSILLTHQIHLRVSNAALKWVANRVLRLAFRKFDSLWVPDTANEPSLAGELSHPSLKGFNVQYIGLLSRLTATGQQSTVNNQQSSVAVVLSGPEPQRTYLEQILLEQALALPQKFVFVKGKTQFQEHHIVAENVEVISYLTSSELNSLLQSSQVVVCRAGYSSLMDLAALGGKKAILIPTPGQTEQEYLGEILSRQNIFICQKQDEVDLEKALIEVEKTTGFTQHKFAMDTFEPVLKAWLDSL